MKILVTDQESSLMSYDTGIELDRLSIQRRPKGTTSGPEGHKHTGAGLVAGLVEKHVDLSKHTMSKIRAECQQQGLDLESADLAAEAGMAQNLTLSYGGVTPIMAVMGMMPRAFFESLAA